MKPSESARRAEAGGDEALIGCAVKLDLGAPESPRQRHTDSSVPDGTPPTYLFPIEGQVRLGSAVVLEPSGKPGNPPVSSGAGPFDAAGPPHPRARQTPESQLSHDWSLGLKSGRNRRLRSLGFEPKRARYGVFAAVSPGNSVQRAAEGGSGISSRPGHHPGFEVLRQTRDGSLGCLCFLGGPLRGQVREPRFLVLGPA